MTTVRAAIALVFVGLVLVMAAAVVLAPLMPYVVGLFFLASVFAIAVRGR